LGYSLQSLDGDDDSHHAISGCHDYAVVLARFQQALILEKVQMPPLLGARVMRRAQLTALRAPKFLALSKSNFKTSRLGSPSKSTFHNLPPRLELQGRRKQRFRCHRSHPVPPRQGFTRAGNEALVPCLPRAPRAPYQNKIIPIYQLSTAGSHVYSPGLT